MIYFFEHIKNGTLEAGSTLVIINDHKANVNTKWQVALCEKNGGILQNPGKPAKENK